MKTLSHRCQKQWKRKHELAIKLYGQCDILPTKLLDDAVFLKELSGRASHSQDVISDPTDERKDW